MEALQARLDSFSQSTRVKSTSAKSTASMSLKWPHPPHFKATPNTLAEAGFYFNPSWDDRDAVTCYMCSKELGDWAENDDPFEIHWTKCKKVCAWAVVRCGLKDDTDDDGNWVFSKTTRLPSGKAMEKARLDTFGPWPYDSERNHGATSKKMARAGFVYTPQSSPDDTTDDTATCFYCNLSLSGWDADDDPLQEHRKREKKSGISCPFFSAASPPAVKPKIPPSRTSSKAPSRSKSMKVTDNQSQLSVSDDELATADVMTGPKKSVKGKSMVASTGTNDMMRASTRRSTRVGSGKTVVSEVEDDGTGGEVEKVAPKKRKGKERKNVEPIEEEVDVEPEPKEAKKTTKRVTNRTKQGTDPPEPEAIPAASTKEPSEKKSKGKKKTGPNDTDTDAVPPTRTKSYARVDSNSDVPVSSKPSQSKKAKKPVSKVAVEAPVSPLKQVPLIRNPDVRRTDVKVVDISTDDENDGAALNVPQDPAPPLKSSKGQAAASSTAELVIIGKVVSADENDAMEFHNISTPLTPPKPKQKSIASPDAEPLPKPKNGKENVDVQIVQPIEMPESLPDVEPPLQQQATHNPRTQSSPITKLPPGPSPPPITAIDNLTNGAESMFIPPLATIPLSKVVSMMECDLDMTVEEWIRHEMAVQYEQFKGDGERAIERFKQKTAEVRRVIETL